MYLEQLTYFQKLAESGSISDASRQLYVSQQALSVAIKKLEEELHTQLFIRTSRGVALTANGEYLLEHTSHILATLEQIQLHFLAARQEPGSLSIGAIPMMQRYLLPKSISYFYKNLPNVRLSVSALSRNTILDMLSQGKLDLGFLSLLLIDGKEDLHLASELHFSPIARLPVTVVTHKNHPLNKYERLSFAQLRQYPTILLDFGNLDDYLPYLILQHYHVSSIFRVDNELLYSQMLEDNLGCSLHTQIPFPGSSELSPNLVIHPLQEKIFSVIGYAYKPSNAEKFPYIKLFCDRLLRTEP